MDSIDWLMIPYGSRGLLLQIWRKVDNDGRLEVGRHGLRGLAVLVGAATDWPLIETDLKPLLDEAVIVYDDDSKILTIAKWFVEAQGAYIQTPDAVRKREKREEARTTLDNAGQRPDETGHVRTCPPASYKEREEKEVERREEKEKTGKAQTALPGLSPQVAQPKGGPARPSKAQLTLMAVGILAELSAARIRVDKRCRPLAPSPGTLRVIEKALERQTVEDLRHVIAMVEAMSVHDSFTRQNCLNASAPFRADNIGRWLTMELEQARTPRQGNAPRQPYSKVPQPMMHPGDDLSRMGVVNPELCIICDKKMTEANPQTNCPACERPGCRACCLPLCGVCEEPLAKVFR